MRPVSPRPLWPQSWGISHHYDQIELYGHQPSSPYVHAYREPRRHTLELVRAAATPGSRVLDVAAVQGNFTLALAEMGYAVTWNNLRAEPFDVVLAAEMIEHVAHPDRLQVAVAQLVKLGGTVVLTTPNGAYFRNPLPCFSDWPKPSVFESQQFKPNADGHIFLPAPEETARLAASAGLEVVETRLQPSHARAPEAQPAPGAATPARRPPCGALEPASPRERIAPDHDLHGDVAPSNGPGSPSLARGVSCAPPAL